MYKALFFVIAAGVGIGLAIPSGKRAAGPAAAASNPTPAKQAFSSEAPHDTVLERESNGHFYVHAKVNGELVRFVVDTGATKVALTTEDARRVGIQFDPGEFQYVGEGASGPVRGKLITIRQVDVDGKTVDDVGGVILEGSQLSLLGQSYLSRMGEVQMVGDTMVLK
jgi:aspartyl protease family protein